MATSANNAVTFKIEDYRQDGGSMEWVVEVDGRMVAAGDCATEDEGLAKARECMATLQYRRSNAAMLIQGGQS